MVELGSETSYKLVCQQLAQESKMFPKQRFVSQRIPYDRRWAAVCLNFDESPIDLYPPGSYIFAEGVYTAAIYQATHEKILIGHTSSAVNIIKPAFVIGCGAALSNQERRLVSRHYKLMSRSD